MPIRAIWNLVSACHWIQAKTCHSMASTTWRSTLRRICSTLPIVTTWITVFCRTRHQRRPSTTTTTRQMGMCPVWVTVQCPAIVSVRASAWRTILIPQLSPIVTTWALPISPFPIAHFQMAQPPMAQAEVAVAVATTAVPQSSVPRPLPSSSHRRT